MSALSLSRNLLVLGDQELIAAIRDGSDEAFAELHARYRPLLERYINGLIGDRSRAEDVAQEVFLSALRSLRAGLAPLAFRPWLYEVARNACIDEYRRVSRVREVVLEPGAEREEMPRAVLIGEPSAEIAAERKQALRDLRGAFHVLSPTHHRMIVMREFEGRSYEEIGQHLEMSHAMVESALFRARRRLSQEYDELSSGRRCRQVQGLIDRQQKDEHRLGLRDRRQLSRHLAHCRSCRRHARLAGFDLTRTERGGLVGKVAALLPIPWLRARRAATGSRTAHAHLQLVRSADGLAPLGAQASGADNLGRAAAAVVAAVAGLGGGTIAVIAPRDGHRTANVVATQPVAARASAGSPAHLGFPSRQAVAAGLRAAAAAGSSSSSSRAVNFTRGNRSPTGEQSSEASTLGPVGSTPSRTSGGTHLPSGRGHGPPLTLHNGQLGPRSGSDAPGLVRRLTGVLLSSPVAGPVLSSTVMGVVASPVLQHDPTGVVRGVFGAASAKPPVYRRGNTTGAASPYQRSSVIAGGSSVHGGPRSLG